MQPDSTTCGVTSVAVMSNYFNNIDYEADDLKTKYNITKGGASVAEMTEWLQAELPKKTIVFKSGGTSEELIGDIHSSLSNGSPVLILFASPNPYNVPYYDSHGSVIYGINLDSETITIANSYGYSEELSLIDFLNQMAYAERDKFPLIQQFIMKIISPEKNMYFIIE